MRNLCASSRQQSRGSVGARALHDPALSLEAVMDVVYGESRSALGKLRKDVLRVAGLG